jgi:hypothetical protein
MTCIRTAKQAHSRAGKDDTFKVSDTNGNVAFFVCSGYGKQPRRVGPNQTPWKISKTDAA